jgi:hypothetical protein
MADEFTMLSACDDRLPVARVVDSIAFHRFIPLRIASDGRSRPAVYPADHAVPELVKESAFGGWPPPDLAEFRGGHPLIPAWEPPSDEATTNPIVNVEVDDLDEFLANPRATVEDERRTLRLSPFNVRALTDSGRTLVRLDDGPPVVVEVTAGDGRRSRDGDVIVSELADVVGGRGLTLAGERVRVSADNIRELRERGATWLRLRDGGEQHDVRVVMQPMTATVGAEPVAGEAISSRPSSTAATVSQPILSSGGLAGALSPGLLDEALRPGRMGIEPEIFEWATPIPSFEFALFLGYRQEWTLVGFARGDLLNTIALAPQEETTIEISSWDRSRAGAEMTEEAGWESSLEAQATGRITRDVANEVTRNEAWKLTSAGVNVNVPQTVEVDLDLAGEFGNTVNNVSRATVSTINEATAKASAKARGMRQTKVTESREWGFEEKTTRRLRNQNLCSSVSYDVFEVLGAYDVSTRVVPEETRLAILVPNPLGVRFEPATILAFEGVLRAALLDPRQDPGFDAVRWLAARKEYCALLKEPPCRRKEEKRAEPAPAQPSATSTTEPDPIEAAEQRVSQAGDRVVGAVRKIRDAGHYVASAYDAGVRGAELEEVILEYRQWLFRIFGLEKFQPGFWGACLRFEAERSSGNRTPEPVEQLLNETASAWAEAAARIYIAALLWQISGPIAAIELVGHLGSKTLWYAPYTARGFDDAGLGAILAQARSAVEAWRRARTSPAATTLGAGQPTASSTPSVTQSTPEGAPGSEPYPEADTAANQIAERALIAHLEHNRSHYLEAIWRAIGPTDRARLLEGAFGHLGQEVEPEVLGFFGDRVALPFRVSGYPQLRDALADAIDDLQDAEVDGARRLVLPTAGVQMKARVDECEACEPFLTSQRTLELQERQAKLEEARAVAAQAELERDRLQARLEADPPQLEDPTTDAPEISVRLTDRERPREQ